MSKYVIELGEDAKAIQSISITSLGNVYVDSWYVENLEELNSDYINEHFGDLQDTAYQRGFEDGKAVNDKGCEGCKYSGTPQGDSPCFNCSNYYQNNWTAKDDKIEVGDEVIWTQDENVAIVVTCVYTKNNMEWCDGVCKDGKVYSILKENARKTGGRFDIDKYLEEINRSKTDGIC